MPRASTRPLPLAATSALLLGALLAGPVVAADDPEAAIEALFEIVSSRELGNLDGIACSTQQDALQDAFSDSGLGLDLMSESFDSMTISIDDLQVEMLEASEGQAEARITGALLIDVDEEQMREFVLELIEVSASPDDAATTDADIDAMLPFMSDILGLEQPFDETVTLVDEDGEWVVCSDFGTRSSDPDDQYEASPIVSNEGLCALATPAELSALGWLEYDSSTGLDEFCTYSQSDWDEYHAATVGLIFDSTLDDWREVYAPDGDLELDDAAAFSSGANVFTQAGSDVLQVTVSLPDTLTEGVDAVSQGVAISELFLPRLDQLVLVEVESEPAGPSLCEIISLQELNTTTGRAFDIAEGDCSFCTWASSDPEAGLDTVLATITDLTLDEYREVLGVVDEGEVAGLMALMTPNEAVIELPDGRTLDVSVYYDESVEPSLPAGLLAITLAEWLAPGIPCADAADGEQAGGGLLAGRDHVDDVCRAVPFEELSAISGVTFEDPIFGGDLCEYSGGAEASGWHYAATSLDYLSLSAWLDDHPDATSIEVGGQPAAVAVNPFGDGEDTALAVVAVPGFDELTFSAYIAIDTSTGTGVDAAAVAEAVVESGLARLIGPAD